ncbi:TPA: ABC transporter ATP-binding protein [Clostridioides difficile]|nr:ABC transporter ATP-binding protein [Clostridioides difficile]HBF4061949.1 ABC transporter ATP-binding protein [Clostridioides difficile]HBF6021736.1 ABC transporter ATP-binding protein [Clostridioides difficile]HBF7091688.1 ABC transporter ATP-binding protein [Clostridioides difficile]HEK8843451.1 ABC transporter ATP-binding protein [Clostridioides difficile]
MTILKTKNLTKMYGLKENNLIVLKDINISINKGEFISIIGPSGSGKSTLLHLLGGLDRPSRGEIIVNGVDINSFSDKKLAEYRRTEIGFVFQQFNLLPILSVKENIELPMMIGEEEIDSNYIEELIFMLGLEEKKDYLPSKLSGGQQQRVAIGRALSTKPSIILADEPTGNLDSKTSNEVIELFKLSSNKYNQTIILVTHDMNIAKKADRVIEIIDGNII